MRITILLFILIFFVSVKFIIAGNDINSVDFKDNYKYLLASGIVGNTSGMYNNSSEDDTLKLKHCINMGKWSGGIIGAGIGLLNLYHLINSSKPENPFWRDFLSVFPATILSTYVGIKIGEWSTKMFINGEPHPLVGILKGGFYGAIDGIVIVAANYVPFFLTAYYLKTLHFNFDENLIVLKLIGTSIAGSFVYGGTFGFAVGALCGPCISFYMKF